MKNNDFYDVDLRIRHLYQKTLISLLSKNYLSNHSVEILRKTKKLAINFLKVSFPSIDPKTGRKKLLKLLKQLDLSDTTDEIALCNIKHTTYDKVRNICNDNPSLFRGLVGLELDILFIFDFCSNSNLDEIFSENMRLYSEENMYLLLGFVINLERDKIKQGLNSLLEKKLITYHEADDIYVLEEVFYIELLRLKYSPVPVDEDFRLEDFELSDPKSAESQSNIHVFSGDFASFYVDLFLRKNNVRFWYEGDLADNWLRLLGFLQKEDFTEGETVWLDVSTPMAINYLENYLVDKIDSINATLYITCKEPNNTILGQECIIVTINDSYLKRQLEDLLPADLAEKIARGICRLPNNNKKCEKLEELKEVLSEHGIDYVNTHFSSIFPSGEYDFSEDDSAKSISIIDEELFVRTYGNDSEVFQENPGIRRRINSIHSKLLNKADYLRADEKMLDDFEKIIQQHPNILNKNTLYQYMKIAVLCSKDKILRMPPILLLGSPGCGKTLLSNQMTDIFRQDQYIQIQLGVEGTTRLLGSTPEYKGASNGRVLSSIWNSKNGINIMNPVIVIEELDKACFSVSTNDIDKDVRPALIQLLGDKNIAHFQDNFFEVPIRNFTPIFIITANSLEGIPEELIDRIQIINFRDYTAEEIKEIIIPLQYKEFLANHENVTERLSADDIDIIYTLAKGQPRKILPAIYTYMASTLDMHGNRIALDQKKIDSLLHEQEIITSKNHSIGFSLCH